MKGAIVAAAEGDHDAALRAKRIATPFLAHAAQPPADPSRRQAQARASERAAERRRVPRHHLNPARSSALV